MVGLVLSLLGVVLCLLQAIAFVTLWERHILGGTQLRVGPNKVLFSGFIQPLLDGVKLLKKEQLYTFNTSPLLFLFIPGGSFLILWGEWLVVPYSYVFYSFSFSFLFFLVVVGSSVYPLLLAGSVSKSKYAMLGAIRASSQTISFEVLYTLLMMVLLLYLNEFLFSPLFNLSVLIWYSLFFISILVELNRAPFDFSEGESELVSGYNVEYGSVGFVLFFLKEYGSLLFFSVLSSVLFFDFSLIVIAGVFSMILYVRSSFPRYRYDLLMGLFWFKLLPLVVNLLLFTFLILL